jgi:DNA-binding MarR family transcriptional regulator
MRVKRARSRTAAVGNPSRSTEVLGQLRVVFGAVRNHHRSIGPDCRISGSQLWLLREIETAPGIGISSLASRLSIHQSTCSLLTEKLVRNRFAARKKDRDDQRRVGLFITHKGSTCLRNAPRPGEEILPKALATLPDTSLRKLQRELQKVVGALDKLDTGTKRNRSISPSTH